MKDFQGQEGTLIYTTGTLSLEEVEMIIITIAHLKPSVIYYKYKKMEDNLAG